MPHPPAEIDVDVSIVRHLLETGCPALASLPIRLVDSGWDNFIFLVGETCAVRLPRRQVAVDLLTNEQRWLPGLASRLPVEVPVSIHVGQPSDQFPWPWSVVNWIAGTTADAHEFQQADVVLLAETLHALHQPAPPDAPVNPLRGVALKEKTPVFQARLDHLAWHPGVDRAALTAIWQAAIQARPAVKRVWLHGDLHPRNVIVRDSAFVGLIDWGDMHGGDVAIDLACTWSLLDQAEHRGDLLRRLNVDSEAVSRARGWAVHMGLALLESEEERHVPLGLATLKRVVEDAINLRQNGARP